MKLLSYSYYDDGYIGNPKIECDCGHIIEFTDGDGIQEDSTVSCPKCGKEAKVVVKLEILFVDVAEQRRLKP